MIKKLYSGILRRLFHTSYTKIHYLRLELNEPTITEKIKDLRYEVIELSLEDFYNGDKSYYDESKIKIYEERLNSGKYKAYGVYIDKKLVYSSWISYENMGFPIVVKPVYLESNEAYLEDDYCMPEYRGKGIHSQVLIYRLSEIIKSGRKVAIITIVDGNNSALNPALKCGFKDIGTFKCGYLFGKKFNTFKNEYR